MTATAEPHVLTRGRLTRYSEALTRPRHATSNAFWAEMVTDTLDFAPWMRLAAIARELGHTWDQDTLDRLRAAHRALSTSEVA